MTNLEKLKKDLNRFAEGEITGQHAEELKTLLQESASVVTTYKSLLEGEKLMADKGFLTDLYLYIREGNEDLRLMRDLKLGLINEQDAQTRGQFKAAALQLVTGFREGRELNVLAGLALLSIAASINDVSLLPRAKAIAKISGD